MLNHIAGKNQTAESVLKESRNRQVWMTVQGSPLYRCSVVLYLYNKTQSSRRVLPHRCHMDLEGEKRRVSFRRGKPEP